jgi:hypothetical protein
MGGIPDFGMLYLMQHPKIQGKQSIVKNLLDKVLKNYSDYLYLLSKPESSHFMDQLEIKLIKNTININGVGYSTQTPSLLKVLLCVDIRHAEKTGTYGPWTKEYFKVLKKLGEDHISIYDLAYILSIRVFSKADLAFVAEVLPLNDTKQKIVQEWSNYLPTSSVLVDFGFFGGNESEDSCSSLPKKCTMFSQTH